ncbi:MAG: potassium-transporting ATPase subunit C, partial [Bdellovibrionales bacterium]|nr:potassium-transporting ATPase subunit C [Bdellovibrionales bacterium]
MKSLKAFLFLAVFCAGVFPALIAVVGLIFKDQATGSLLRDPQGNVVGSRLLAQPFESKAYFWGRPSSTDQLKGQSQASNLSMTDKRLRAQLLERTVRWQELHGNAAPPPEMISASASGFDPHISPFAAVLQIDRVMAARAMESSQRGLLLELIEEATEGPTSGLFGESRINV